MRRCVELLVASLVMAVIPVISAFPQKQPSPAGMGWIEFNGKNSFAVTEDEGLFNLGDRDFTIEAWIYPKDTLEKNNEWVIIAEPANFELLLVGPGNRLLEKWCKGSNFAFFFVKGFRTTMVCSIRFNDPWIFNKWHHIRLTRGKERMILYFDGQRRGSGPPEMIDNSVNNIYIGGIPGRQNSFFDGAMDEMRILTKMLEPKRQWNFEAKEIEGRLKADKDTIALWHFDDQGRLKTPLGTDIRSLLKEYGLLVVVKPWIWQASSPPHGRISRASISSYLGGEEMQEMAC
ncbi:TPA: LamG domain-containing protein [Candidatus Poribacteria bacterium]|nr:LamG domain-containing protein [Candidatus Poribacteria bacterium]